MSLEIRNNGCLEPAPQSANLPQPTFIIRFTAQPTVITFYTSETSILGKERAKRKLVPLYILELLCRQCTWFIHSEAVHQVLCACFRYCCKRDGRCLEFGTQTVCKYLCFCHSHLLSAGISRHSCAWLQRHKPNQRVLWQKKRYKKFLPYDKKQRKRKFLFTSDFAQKSPKDFC